MARGTDRNDALRDAQAPAPRPDARGRDGIRRSFVDSSFGPSCRPCGRSGSTDRGRANDDIADERVAVALTRGGVAADGVRRRSVDLRTSRRLRCGIIRGDTAATRACRPTGARRRTWAGHASGSKRRVARCPGRHRGRSRAGGGITAKLVAVSGILALATMAACWFPARRAARIDPMQALRVD